PVVADDGKVHSALEALCGQPAGKSMHLVGDLFPSPALPDAEILLADGGTVALFGCMMQQQRREILACGCIARVWALQSSSPANWHTIGVMTASVLQLHGRRRRIELRGHCQRSRFFYSIFSS